MSIATSNTSDGTAATASLLDSGSAVQATASGLISSNAASLTLTAPANLPAGAYVVQVEVAGANNSPYNAGAYTINAQQQGPPPIDLTVATSVANSTDYLYTGDHPVQTGVSGGTIEAGRAAVLRGKVLAQDGAPLPGVTITILGHPEFGQTITQADGYFDMAVNGGGQLTVNYTRAGYLPAQRGIDVPWLDYSILPDVMMITYDSSVTEITLDSESMQVAQGSQVSDDSGTRRATVMFPADTSAQLLLPDGDTQPLSSISLRATEYTVGGGGPQAMPAELPPTVGYTYAVDLTADQAVAAGAEQVTFSQPVYFYVENFLNFPVGGIVPAAYYDRDRAAWIPSDNGLIIQITSVSGGLADLDLDGDGSAEDPEALSGLGITDDERK